MFHYRRATTVYCRYVYAKSRDVAAAALNAVAAVAVVVKAVVGKAVAAVVAAKAVAAKIVAAAAVVAVVYKVGGGASVVCCIGFQYSFQERGDLCS